MTTNVAAGAERICGKRFRILDVLKEGQGIETLRALDLVGGGEAVVKSVLASRFTAGALQRLEHEAVVLRELESPYTTPLLEFGRENGTVYLATSLVHGATLRQRLLQGALTVGETLDVGRCLLQALVSAHKKGILHRDIKPDNVIVDGESRVTRATLIDFGLARSAQLDASVRDMPVGNLFYIAPEQAGLVDRGVDERSDLYALGLVLHECLRGQRPFDAPTVNELLRQHLMVRPPELRSVGVIVPRAFDDVIQRLIRKDPRDRYHTASGALADLDAIAKALAEGVLEPTFTVGTHDHRRSLTEAQFIGREAEIATLGAELDRSRRGQGRLVLLEAESGGGKSRLLDEFAQKGVEKDVWVLRGNGSGQAAERPLAFLEGIVRGLLATARADAAFADSLKQRLLDRKDAITAALPQLSAIFGQRSQTALGPEEFGEARTLSALAALLSALGTRERPALVLFDDAQWADGLTQKLWSQWAHGAAETKNKTYVTLVLAVRTEEGAEEHALDKVPVGTRISLRRLTDEEVRSLAESMAGILPPVALDTIVTLASGVAFLVGAVLQGLVETGALIEGSPGWKVDLAKLSEAQSSRRAASFLVARLEKLSAPARKLLSAGAVMGRQFELAVAAGLSDLDPKAARAALDEARRRQIVWADAQESCAFVHNRLRDTLLEQMAEDERKSVHLRAAIQIEETDAARVNELAYHFERAGELARAFPHALLGAEEARAQYSPEIAERLFRIAERGAGDKEKALCLRVAQGLGDVLMMQADFPGAEAEYQRARQFAGNRREEAILESKRGELAMRRGDIRSSGEALVQALKLLGYATPPGSRLLLALMFFWELCVQILHTYLPRLFVGRRSLASAGDETLAMELHGLLRRALYYSHGPLDLLWVDCRALNLCERYPPTPELARSYALHAMAMASVPMNRRAVRYAEKALVIRRASQDVWGLGHALHYYGMVLYQATRFKEGLEKSREAVELLERTGDRQEMYTASIHIAQALFRMGRCQEAVELCRRLYQGALKTGQRVAKMGAVGVWSQATEGNLPEDIAKGIVTDLPQDALSRQTALRSRARYLIFQKGDLREALAFAIESDAIVKAQRKRNEYVAGTPLVAANALRLLAMQAYDGSERTKLIEQCQEVLKRAMPLARSFQNSLPFALRESGLLAALEGDALSARTLLDESLATAERQEHRYEWAVTLAARGELGKTFQWPDADDDLERARIARKEMGLPLELERHREALRLAQKGGPRPEESNVARVVSTEQLAQSLVTGASLGLGSLSLVDRFATVQEVGRTIASALTEDAVIKAVRNGALQLLRGEECLVMGRDMNLLAGDETFANRDVSERLVMAAWEKGAPSALDEQTENDTARGSSLGGAGSALCAPVLVRGTPAFCLYTLHRGVQGLFGNDELRLAEFISTIAGAALENVRFVRELEEAHAQMADKHRLEKEMEIAANIQTKILPRTFQVKGLDIAAKMLPATEVGGDYYDVRPTKDGTWIGIGDVAGHGLPTGLVMLMIQSVVAALSRQEEASPRDLVAQLNRVVYENVHDRLDQDEHATLTLFRYRDSGELVFAGAHEDIIICRARTGLCELIATNGTWLAAKRDIENVTEDTTVRLEPGDLLLLYTDGIPEAMNAEGAFYGLERLCEQLEKAKGEPVERIVERVLADVRAFTSEQKDDMTLLVARQRGEPVRTPG